MFKVNDTVTFGIRYGNGIRKGGIARKAGIIINIDDLATVKSEGKLYNLRRLKGGWVLETERDDPKGRLYMKLD